ncbi:Uncharacterised protein [Streptococcus pneumoniae]|nr:Uncharacterised protein [Streptococcus pneumoniae]
MTITITSNLSGLTKAFMRHLRGILLRIFWRLSSTMSNIQTNVRIQIMVLVTLATMFKETKMVKLIPIKRKNQARRNLRQKNLRKKPLEKRNRKARNQSLQNQQRNQKKNHQRNQKNLRSRLKRLKKN